MTNPTSLNESNPSIAKDQSPPMLISSLDALPQIEQQFRQNEPQHTAASGTQGSSPNSQQRETDPNDADASLVDQREQLFNAGEIGPIQEIQVSKERITQQRGICFDIDPKLIQSSSLFPNIPQNPDEFYQQVVKPCLARHPVLRQAEVRNSGTGLHAILRFNEPVVFQTDHDRQRWSGTVQVVQGALPIDPDQPGITAVTRAIGSINSKNGATVKQLCPGEPVTPDEVLTLYDELQRAPFQTITRILTGRDKVSPCPICRAEGSQLSALTHTGRCYGSCGTVSLAQLYDVVLAPRSTVSESANDTQE